MDGILLIGLNRPWMEPTVYYTEDEKANQYTIDMMLFDFDLLEFRKKLLLDLQLQCTIKTRYFKLGQVLKNWKENIGWFVVTFSFIYPS